MSVGSTAFRMIAGSTCDTIILLILYRHVWLSGYGSKHLKTTEVTHVDEIMWPKLMGFLLSQILSRQNHRSFASQRTSTDRCCHGFPDVLMGLRVHCLVISAEGAWNTRSIAGRLPPFDDCPTIGTDHYFQSWDVQHPGMCQNFVKSCVSKYVSDEIVRMSNGGYESTLSISNLCAICVSLR